MILSTQFSLFLLLLNKKRKLYQSTTGHNESHDVCADSRSNNKNNQPICFSNQDSLGSNIEAIQKTQNL